MEITGGKPWRIVKPAAIIYSVAATLLILGLGRSAAAENYYVDQNHPQASDTNIGTDQEHPWRTIDKACATARPGDVISIKGSSDPLSPAAVYNRAGKHGLPIKTPGRPDRTITFQAAPGQTVILEGNLTNYGIDLSKASYHTFRGLVFRKFDKATEGTGATGVLIEKCEFTQTAETGLRLRAMTNLVLRDVYVHHCREAGIFLKENSKNVLFERVESSYNDAPSDADGFTLHTCDNVKFVHCIARDNADDGFDLHGNVTLIDCVSSGNTHCNAKVWRRPLDDFRPHSVTIINSIFYNAGEAGIKVNEGAVLNLYHSVLSGNGEEGVAFRPIKNDKGPKEVVSRLVNNIFVGNAIGVGIHQGPEFRVKVLADHNLYFGNKAASTGLAEDGGAIIDKEPRFFAPRRGNFHLQDGSPALAAGRPLPDQPDAEKDFDGQPRPAGGAPDLGPFQRDAHPDNRPPVFLKPATDHFDIDEGQTLRVKLSAEDPAGRRLVYYLPGELPKEMSVNADTGEFTFTPSFGQGGSRKEPAKTYQVHVAVTNRDYAKSDTLQLTVTAHHVNRPPVYDGLPVYTLIEGRPFNLALDISTPEAGVAVRAEVEGLPAGARFVPGEGRICWTPATGQIGRHDTRVILSDPVFTKSFDLALEVLPEEPYAATRDSAQIFFVDAENGSDHNSGRDEKSAWKTIQRAANYLRPGQMALVRRGVYAEQVGCKTPGRADAPIIFKAYPGEKPVMDGATLKNSPKAVRLAAHVVWDGIELKNYETAFDLRGKSEDIVIVNCAAKKIENYGVLGFSGDRLRLENLTFEDVGDRAILGGGTNLHLYNVRVARAADRGLSIGSAADNLNLIRCEFSECGRCGALVGAKNTFLADCTVRDNHGINLRVTDGRALAANSVFSGAKIQGGEALNVLVDNNASADLLFCVIAQSERHGLAIREQTGRCRLLDSIVYQNKELAIVGLELKQLVEDHNLFFSSYRPITPKGPASRVGDPKFVAPEAGDFRLQGDSPARAAGVEIEEFKPKSEAMGKAPDLGVNRATVDK